MPLSVEQSTLLKDPATSVRFQQVNPKTPGTKAYERFEKYKHATKVKQASAMGAKWAVMQSDFEKEYFKFVSTPASVDVGVEGSGSAIRSAPEGSPDREQSARSKHVLFCLG